MMYQTNCMDCVAHSEQKTVWEWKSGVRKRPCAVILFIWEKQVKTLQNKSNNYPHKIAYGIQTDLKLLRNPSCGAQNMAVLRHILTAAPSSPRCICHRQRSATKPGTRVPRSLNHFTQCQNKNGHLSVTVFDLAERVQLNPNLNPTFQGRQKWLFSCRSYNWKW